MCTVWLLPHLLSGDHGSTLWYDRLSHHLLWSWRCCKCCHKSWYMYCFFYWCTDSDRCFLSKCTHMTMAWSLPTSSMITTAALPGMSRMILGLMTLDYQSMFSTSTASTQKRTSTARRIAIPLHSWAEEWQWRLVFQFFVAEQTNAWIGGYHSVCCEMLVDKFNFFWDEMVIRCNHRTLLKLEKDGHSPHYWPHQN